MANAKDITECCKNAMFSSSDDNVTVEQIQATHAPEGQVVEVNVRPLLRIIEDILNRVAPTIPGINAQTTQPQPDAISDDKALQAGFNDMLKLMPNTINKISCELISCKCLGCGDAHATAVAILKTVSGYKWDAKVVIALAAFAVNYGKFWLVAQLHLSNPLAKSVAILEQLPDILERADTLKLKFEALGNLTKAMLGVTKCIVEFNELPTEMQTDSDNFHMAVYWTIRSMVVCASQIMGLIGMDLEYIASTTETGELSSLAYRVSNIHFRLKEQLLLSRKQIDTKRQNESRMELERLIEKSKNGHNDDNMEILKILLICHTKVQLSIYEASTKTWISIEKMGIRKKNVLLFISDLDLTDKEISFLILLEKMAHAQHDILWLPVIDRSTPWNDVKQKQFETLRGLIPCYSVYDPSMLDQGVIQYIKEVWHFCKIPLIVLLDKKGVVWDPKDLYKVIWLWGRDFSFTKLPNDEQIWLVDNVTWDMSFLAGAVSTLINNWIKDKKYICLYGGEDIKWITEFTVKAYSVAQTAGIQLEMIYVGKSNPGEKVWKIVTAIVKKKLSHAMPADLNEIRFFWLRLQSIKKSKMDRGKTVENDPVLREITKVISFDESNRGWAVISNESDQMAKAKGDTILQSLTKYEDWKHRVEKVGFVPALNEHLNELNKTAPCEKCGRPMENQEGVLNYQKPIDKEEKDGVSNNQKPIDTTDTEKSG